MQGNPDACIGLTKNTAKTTRMEIKKKKLTNKQIKTHAPKKTNKSQRITNRLIENTRKKTSR